MFPNGFAFKDFRATVVASKNLFLLRYITNSAIMVLAKLRRSRLRTY